MSACLVGQVSALSDILADNGLEEAGQAALDAIDDEEQSLAPADAGYAGDDAAFLEGGGAVNDAAAHEGEAEDAVAYEGGGDFESEERIEMQGGDGGSSRARFAPTDGGEGEGGGAAESSPQEGVAASACVARRLSFE